MAINNNIFKALFISRRATFSGMHGRGRGFTALAEKLGIDKKSNFLPETMKKAADSEAPVYWIRDPKSGHWVPENQISSIHKEDPVELRNKFIYKKFH